MSKGKVGRYKGKLRRGGGGYMKVGALKRKMYQGVVVGANFPKTNRKSVKKLRGDKGELHYFSEKCSSNP